MKNDSSITVIVPAYNAEKTIEKCIDSIINQTLSAHEIFVINDGSVDNTTKILKKYLNNKNIKIFNKNNEGVSLARNYGLDRVNSKYVAFVDSDDYIEKDFLEVLYNNLHSNKDVDLSICGVTHYNEPNKPKKYNTHYSRSGLHDSTETIEYLLSPNSPQGYLCNKLWKMSIIEQNNLRLDPKLNMAEDLLFTIFYLLKAKNVIISNQCLYNYMHKQDSLSSDLLLNNNQKKFLKTNQDFLIVCKRIIEIAPTSRIKRAAVVFWSRNASFFLRQLNLINFEGYSKLKKELLEQCKRNLRYVICSNSMSLKNKFAYIGTIYFSRLIVIYDRNKRN